MRRGSITRDLINQDHARYQLIYLTFLFIVQRIRIYLANIDRIKYILISSVRFFRFLTFPKPKPNRNFRFLKIENPNHRFRFFGLGFSVFFRFFGFRFGFCSSLLSLNIPLDKTTIKSEFSILLLLIFSHLFSRKLQKTHYILNNFAA